MQVKLNTILLSPSSPLIEYHTSIKMDWNLLWFFVTKILLTFADSLIFIKGLQFGYLWKIIWQIFMFSEKSFSFCKTIRANLQQYTTNVILFKLECIYYMYENANDVSLKNDIYVQLKFYKYMYTSIGI